MGAGAVLCAAVSVHGIYPGPLCHRLDSGTCERIRDIRIAVRTHGQDASVAEQEMNFGRNASVGA